MTSTQVTIPKRSRSAAASLLRDPVLFARIVLGADLWKTQGDILAAVGQHNRVAVKALPHQWEKLRNSDRCAVVVNRTSRRNRGHDGSDLAAGGKSDLG